MQIFSVGSRQFAVPADQISAVAEWREPVPLPHAPVAVRGIVSIKGSMLTLLDLARLSESQKPSADDTARQIVALRGDEQLALAVDSMGESVEARSEDLPKTNDLVSGTISHNGAEIGVLNLENLFRSVIRGRERRRRRF